MYAFKKVNKYKLIYISFFVKFQPMLIFFEDASKIVNLPFEYRRLFSCL
jgi:hypothetical protein